MDAPAAHRCCTVNIRPAAAADIEAIVALWQVVFPEYANPAFPQRNSLASVRRKLAFDDGLFWVGEADGRLIGTAMAGYDGHRGWLYSLGVHPDQRGRGHGRALLRRAEEALAALGCPKINLQVTATNAAGIRFWRAGGYRQDEVLSLGKRLI
jgi:ribosomal protein S18 acetylase RimI-like enzyme